MLPFGLETIPINADVLNLFIAGALGMLLGLEREWSNKSAGIRTFTLTSLVGAATAVLGQVTLLALGGALVLLQGTLLGVRGLVVSAQADINEDSGLALTTSTSLFVAYVVGVLVGIDYLLIAVIIAITSSFLLVLRRELHQFANKLSHQEVRSFAEFAIISFVVYPLLPDGTYGPWGAIDPQLIWLLVIAVSAIGFVNYAIMSQYGSRGMIITGFFGGLVNSTAVIGEMANRAKNNMSTLNLAVATVLVADAAMAVRNLIIVIGFVPQSAFSISLPLGLIAVGGIALTGYERSRADNVDLDLDSPFSSKNALTFGGLFLVVLVITAGAQQMFGTAGFLITSLLSGLLSSGTTTTTAVSLVSTGQITPAVAAQGVLAGTLASILVKIWLAVGISRDLFVPVSIRSIYLVILGLLGIAVIEFV